MGGLLEGLRLMFFLMALPCCQFAFKNELIEGLFMEHDHNKRAFTKDPELSKG